MMVSTLILSLMLQDKKGLQIQMPDDALALGVRQAALNVVIGDWVTDTPTAARLEDTSLYLRDPELNGLSNVVKLFRKRDIKVYLILLTRRTGSAKLDQVLLHPKFDIAAPNHYSAFNVVTPEGVSLIRSFTSALAEKLGPKEIAGWIVGNEVNSHWYWANQGAASIDEVADTTERSLRLVAESTKQPVYLSLEHHWNMRYLDNPLQTVPGRQLLDSIAKLSRERGDFGWRVAFHPYPENLFNPRFWEDKTATLSFDAPRVTFRNLEVLTEYLKQPNLRWKGKPRIVNLTEQGFHRVETEQGEIEQAAAYAYAYNRVKRNPGIEGFILNRHVDNVQEGGLNLGLWTRKPGSIADPDRKTKMYEVFAACGTPREEEATRFALPIIGLKSWEESGPKRVKK